MPRPNGTTVEIAPTTWPNAPHPRTKTRPDKGCPPDLWPPNCAMAPFVPPTASTMPRVPTPTLNTSLGSPIFGPKTWGRGVFVLVKMRCLTPSPRAPCATPEPAHARGRPTANVVRRTRVEPSARKRRCPTRCARPIGRVPPLHRQAPTPQVGPGPRSPGPLPIRG